MYAHGGIVAAAAAILQDMAQHNLLHRLLEEYDPYGLDSPQPQDGYASWHQNMNQHNALLELTFMAERPASRTQVF